MTHAFVCFTVERVESRITLVVNKRCRCRSYEYTSTARADTGKRAMDAVLTRGHVHVEPEIEKRAPLYGTDLWIVVVRDNGVYQWRICIIHEHTTRQLK